MTYKRYKKKNYKAKAVEMEDGLDTRVHQEITQLLFKFEQPDSLDFIAKTMFTRGVDIPSDNWSLLNRLIMMAHNSTDARGYKAWMKSGRKCEAGKSFYILAPRMRRFKKKDESGDDKVVSFCNGFYPIVVWPYEGTTGDEPIDYKPDQELPDFQCKEVADQLGIKVTQGFKNTSYYGYYDPNKKEIMMATPSQQTFFHELCHAVDHKLLKKKNKDLKGGQDPAQEIVAEFSSCVLMRMFGLKAETSDKAAFKYIESYSKKMKRKTIRGVAELLPRIEGIIKYVVEKNNELVQLQEG